MEIEEIKKILENKSLSDIVLIGLPDERENYYSAIVEVDEQLGRVTYDYDLLVECFFNEFKKECPDKSFEKLLVEAIEHVECNVVRSLPYWGEHAPLVEIIEDL